MADDFTPIDDFEPVADFTPVDDFVPVDTPAKKPKFTASVGHASTIGPATGISYIKHPLKAALESVKQQYQEGMEEGEPFKALFSILNPVLQPVQNLVRTAHSAVLPLFEEGDPTAPLYSSKEKELLKSNLAKVTNLGAGRPTTGAEAGDVASDLSGDLLTGKLAGGALSSLMKKLSAALIAKDTKRVEELKKAIASFNKAISMKALPPAPTEFQLPGAAGPTLQSSGSRIVYRPKKPQLQLPAKAGSISETASTFGSNKPLGEGSVDAIKNLHQTGIKGELLPPAAPQVVLAEAAPQSTSMVDRVMAASQNRPITEEVLAELRKIYTEEVKNPELVERLLEEARNGQLREVVTNNARESGLLGLLQKQAKRPPKTPNLKATDVWERGFEPKPLPQAPPEPGVLQVRGEKVQKDLEQLETALKQTRDASKTTGVVDRTTERTLEDAIKNQKTMLSQVQAQEKGALEAAKAAQKAEKDALKGTPAPTATEEAPKAPRTTLESLKDWFSKWTPELRSKDKWAEASGYKPIVDQVHNATYNKGFFISKFLEQYHNIKIKYNLDKASGELIAEILNGNKAPLYTRPDLGKAAEEIRTQVFEPIHQLIKEDPQLASLIGEVGYLKDYFPHMQAAWASQLKDPALVQQMIHDLKPGRLKSRFWKTRPFEEPEFNKNLDSVIEAYIRGSAKTKYDLLAYNEANRLAGGVKNAIHKEKLVDYLRNYIGQPSSRGSALGEAKSPITRWYYRTFIGANPLSAGVNLSQTYLNTVTRAGYISTGKAIKYVVSPSTYKQAMTEARRAGALEGYPQVSESLYQAWKKDLKEKNFGDVADDFLFLAFKFSEQLNRATAFHAGKLKYLSKHPGDAEEATRAGWKMVLDTQFLYGKVSPVGYVEKYPVLGQFSTYPLKQAEFILDTMLRGDKGMRARLLAQYGSAIAAVTAYLQWKDKLSIGGATSLLGDVAPLPGVGPFIKDMADFQNYLYQLREGNQKTENLPKKALKAAAERTPLIRQFMKAAKSEEE